MMTPPASLLVRDARRHLAAGARDPDLGTREVARRLGVSARTLERAYRAAGAGSIAEDLRAARLRVGAQLLSEQSLPVELVSRLSGHRSVGHFSRAFARRYGMSPPAFRAAARSAPQATHRW